MNGHCALCQGKVRIRTNYAGSHQINTRPFRLWGQLYCGCCLIWIARKFFTFTRSVSAAKYRRRTSIIWSAGIDWRGEPWEGPVYKDYSSALEFLFDVGSHSPQTPWRQLAENLFLQRMAFVLGRTCDEQLARARWKRELEERRKLQQARPVVAEYAFALPTYFHAEKTRAAQGVWRKAE